MEQHSKKKEVRWVDILIISPTDFILVSFISL